jgi:hypothetical protein
LWRPRATSPRPGRLVKHEADGTDADEVVGEHLVEGGGVAVALGVGPRREQVVDVGGHRGSFRSCPRGSCGSGRCVGGEASQQLAKGQQFPVGEVGAEALVEDPDGAEQRPERGVALVGELDLVRRRTRIIVASLLMVSVFCSALLITVFGP